MKVIPEILKEATELVLKHHADQIKKNLELTGTELTEELSNRIFSANQENINREISKLYVMIYDELKKVA